MSGNQVLGGVLLGALLGAGGMYVVTTYVLEKPVECEESTPVEVEEPVVEAAEEEPGKKKSRKGRRGKTGAGEGADEGEGEVLASGPAVDDDRHVPRHDANADQRISMSDGTGRLSDAEIDRELAKLDKPFQACVRDAAARVQELGSGTVKYHFGVDGRGKVTGVTVNAPSNLQDAGIVPCVRLAVHGHRFPAFDGPTMSVNSSFSVD